MVSYDQMLGESFSIEEGGDDQLTTNQRRALSAPGRASSSPLAAALCGDLPDSRRLRFQLVLLWALSATACVLGLVALGRPDADSGGGGVHVRAVGGIGGRSDYCANNPNQVFGEEVLEFSEVDAGGRTVTHHYQVIGGHWAELTWHQAHGDVSRRCYEGVEGHLAHIGSAAENLFLLTALKDEADFYTGNSAWFGATDLENEGTFEWIGGSRNGEVFYTEDGAVDGVYTNWHEGEPGDSFGKEDCVLMYGGGDGHDYDTHDEGTWNDSPCYRQKEFFFVEYDA